MAESYELWHFASGSMIGAASTASEMLAIVERVLAAHPDETVDDYGIDCRLGESAEAVPLPRLRRRAAEEHADRC